MNDTIFKKLLNKIDLKEDRHLFENAPLGRFMEYIGFMEDYKFNLLSVEFLVIGKKGEDIFALEFVEITSAEFNGDYISTKQLEELTEVLTILITEL
jgi:hypothetical protein